MRIYTLPHDEVCGDECFCTAREHAQTVHNPKTGDVGVRMIPLSVAMSVHIPAGGVWEKPPDAAVNCKQIAADIKAGLLAKEEN